jgi:type I restriction enzyme S subunit
MGKTLLKDRVEFQYGYSVRVNDEKSGEYPVFGSNGITGYIDSYKVKSPGVIIGRKGSVGAIRFSDKNFTPTDTAYYLSIKDKTKDDIKFWYYYLQLLGLEKLNTHSSVPGLSREIAYFVNVNPPDISTQQKIAAVLSALDAKIELNQRINAELESMAKTLYDYWFVQFDFPNEKGKPYKSAGGKMVWNEELKREIPLGWEVGELGNYCQTFRGVTYKKEDVKSPFDKNTIPILRATNISNAVIDVNDMIYIPEELVSEDQMMEKFDVLITMSSGSKAHVGKNAFYYYDNKVSFGAFCSKLSANKNIRFYVNIHMQSDGFKKYISNVGLGTNINNLTNKHITEYKLLIPSKEVLLQFENTVKGFYNKIGNNMKESQTLTELRDWLLPMLMNGQVKV